MKDKNGFGRCTALSLCLLIVVSILTSCGKFVRQGSAPTVPCEQPPASLVPLYPDGSECNGTDEQVRTCYSLQTAHWAISMQQLYTGEVDKRANQDACLAKLRRDGLIK